MLLVVCSLSFVCMLFVVGGLSLFVVCLFVVCVVVCVVD